MPFDLSTAQPVADQGFDLSTAKPLNAAPAPATKAPLSFKDFLAAVPEAAAHFGTGALAAPLAGLSGISQGIQNAYDSATGAPVTRSAADAVEQTQGALTYNPQTQGGQNTANAVAYPFQKLAQGADIAGQATSNVLGPAAGAAVNTGIQSIPMLLGAKLAAGRSLPTPAAAAIDPAVAETTGAGFKLTPAQAGGSTAKMLESLVGPAKLERSVSKSNAPLVNELSKSDIGIPENQPINDATLNAAKAPHNAIYSRVSQLGAVPTDANFQSAIGSLTNRTGAGSFGFDVSPAVENLKQGYGTLNEFDAGDAVNKIRQLRKDANMNFKAYDPEKNALASAQKGVASALEDQLDRHVQQLSQTGLAPPDLISQLRDARVSLAKIHSVEDALQGQNVSAKSLSKQQDRGVPLTGNLETIANSYKNFDRSFQDVSKIRDSGPFGYLDAVLGAGAALAHPIAGAAILARPLARGFLASNAYQKAGIGGGLQWPEIPAASVLPAIGSEQSRQSLGVLDQIGLPGAAFR